MAISIIASNCDNTKNSSKSNHNDTKRTRNRIVPVQCVLQLSEFRALGSGYGLSFGVEVSAWNICFRADNSARTPRVPFKYGYMVLM